MISVLYNLLQTPVVLICIVLSIIFIIVVQEKAMGSMKEQFQAVGVSYRVVPQFLFITTKLLVIIALGFMLTILITKIGSDPIYCQDTNPPANNNQTEAPMSTWNKGVLGTWTAGFLYLVYKGAQVKSIKQAGGIVTVLAAATAAASSMAQTGVNPAGVQANIIRAHQKVHPQHHPSGTGGSASGSGYYIHSPLEEVDSWSVFDWLYYYLPSYVQQQLRSRVPSADFESLNTVEVLHFQYNVIVFLLTFCLLIVVYSNILAIVLEYAAKNRESIAAKSSLLSKLIPSDSTLSVLLYLLKGCVLISIITSFFGLWFMYTHPFVF